MAASSPDINELINTYLLIRYYWLFDRVGARPDYNQLDENQPLDSEVMLLNMSGPM